MKFILSVILCTLFIQTQAQFYAFKDYQFGTKEKFLQSDYYGCVKNTVKEKFQALLAKSEYESQADYKNRVITTPWNKAYNSILNNQLARIIGEYRDGGNGYYYKDIDNDTWYRRRLYTFFTKLQCRKRNIFVTIQTC